MPDRKITIRIGASLDADLKNVFVPFSTGARKARDTVAKEFAGAVKSTESGAKKMSSAAKKADADIEAAFAKLEQEVSGKGAKLTTTATKSIQSFAKESKSVFEAAAANFKGFASEAEASMRKVEKATTAAQLGLAKATSGRGGRNGGAVRVGKGAAISVGRGAAFGIGMARQGLSDLDQYAAAMGVETQFTGHIAANQQLETTVGQISNSAYMPGGQGPNGQRQDPKDIARDIKDAANSAGYGYQEAAEGLQAFVGKTGDLALGREVFKDLARLSRATGTNLNDMVSAAGEVSNSMGDIPEKGAKMAEVMRVVAGQGKLGAVEISEMANRLGKLAASAPRFEGDFGKNMALMGAITQEARARGGSSSAAQAATSVESFVGTFSKKARVSAFKAAGIDVYSKTETGKIKDPEQLIIEALQKKGMNPEGFNGLFADKRAQSAVGGFANIYRETYNKTKGTPGASTKQIADEKMAAATNAVKEEFEHLKSVAMTNAEVNESFSQAMKSTETKVQLFNNAMQDTSSRVQQALLPALTDLAPKLVTLANAAASAIEFVTGHTEATDTIDKSLDEQQKAEKMTNAYNKALGTGEVDEEHENALNKEKQELVKLRDQAKAGAATDKQYIEDNPGLAELGNTRQQMDNENATAAMLDKQIAAIDLAQSKTAMALMQGTLKVRVENFTDMPKITPAKTVSQ